MQLVVKFFIKNDRFKNMISKSKKTIAKSYKSAMIVYKCKKCLQLMKNCGDKMKKNKIGTHLAIHAEYHLSVNFFLPLLSIQLNGNQTIKVNDNSLELFSNSMSHIESSLFLTFFVLFFFITFIATIIAYWNYKLRTRVKLQMKEIKTSEEYRNRIFESSIIPIIVMDPDSNKFIDCNQAAVEIYRYKFKEEVIGKSLTEVSPTYQDNGELSSDKSLYYIETALKSESIIYNWKHQRPNGELWDSEVHLLSFNIGEKKLLQFSLLDITEQKRAIQLMHDIIDKNPMSIQILDKQGYTIRINQAHTKLFGAIPPEDYSVFEDNQLRNLGYKELIDRAKAGEIIHFPDFCYNAHLVNQEFPDLPVWIRMIIFPLFDNSGNIERYVLMHEDITDKKLYEEALRKSESLARTVIDNSTTGISVRSNTGQLLLYNQAWINMWEISEERLEKDLKPREVLKFNERDEYFSQYHEGVLNVYRNGGSYTIPEISTSGKFSHSGKPRCINQHFTGITNKDGVVERVVILSYDITESKQAELEKEKLISQLIHAQKMESIGRLAGGVAHDFNNMLGVIIGYTDLAMGLTDSNISTYKYLQEIGKAAKRSANLTRQLLAYARKQTVNPIVLELNEAIKGMKKMLGRLIGEDIELSYNPSNYPIFLEIDPSQIDQILANLCINARDAISNTGKITIETMTININEEYSSSHIEALSGEFALLIIGDNGCGMDIVTLENLFEPFYTTKEIGKGTGLGLATVYGIIKQNNGFIEVNSDLGIGSIFKIYLPLYKNQFRQSLQMQASTSDIGGNETILLVEDEKTFLNMTREMLEMHGYNVLATISPKEALNIANQHKDKIDLLITDVIMPEMNGRDLSYKILDICPDIKRLYMSGYTASVIEHHGVLEKGANFIQKPFNIESLAEKVREILDNE